MHSPSNCLLALNNNKIYSNSKDLEQGKNMLKILLNLKSLMYLGSFQTTIVSLDCTHEIFS